VDSLHELFELWFDRRGRVASFSPPSDCTEQDMELMSRVTAVLPPLFTDAPTVRIQRDTSTEDTDAVSTQWLTAVPWFERGSGE
jgi:hypothetical protein